MATCAVSGTILTPDGVAATSCTVFAKVTSPVFSGVNLITPFEISVVANASGNFTLTVQQSISVIFTVQYPIVGTEPMRSFKYTGTIPATATASFSSIVTIE